MTKISNKWKSHQNKTNILDILDYKPLPFQRIVFKEFLKDQNVFCLKSRQMGISTLLRLYSLYYAIQNPYSIIVYGDINATSKYNTKSIITDLITKFTDKCNTEVYEKIIPFKVNNHSLLELGNGTKIFFKSFSIDFLRGFRPDLIILDDFLHYGSLRETWFSSIYPCINTSKIVICSNNKDDDFANELWETTSFKKIHLPIYLNDFYCERYKEIKDLIPDRAWTIEYLNPNIKDLNVGKIFKYFKWFNEIEELNKPEMICQ